MRVVKKAVLDISNLETSVHPYQKMRAITQKDKDWEKAKIKFDQRDILFDLLRGSSKLLEYSLRQSASRVSEETVRMAPMASHASLAESAWADLFCWSFKTTIRFETSEQYYTWQHTSTHKLDVTCWNDKRDTGWTAEAVSIAQHIYHGGTNQFQQGQVSKHRPNRSLHHQSVLTRLR